MISEKYQELVLDASDVCQSCFRQIRVERVDPTRTGMVVEYEQRLARNERTTVVDYAPADNVKDHKGVFCECCGTESAFDRVWDAGDVHDPRAMFDRERFKTLTKHCLRSLERKGLTLDRGTFVRRALAELDDGAMVDEALSAATDHALAVAGTDGTQADA